MVRSGQLRFGFPVRRQVVEEAVISTKEHLFAPLPAEAFQKSLATELTHLLATRFVMQKRQNRVAERFGAIVGWLR
jgi:hypothetical protein